jgi:hypothetical protein
MVREEEFVFRHLRNLKYRRKIAIMTSERTVEQNIWLMKVRKRSHSKRCLFQHQCSGQPKEASKTRTSILQ